MLLLALTISEAAAILGISPDASNAEINTAYRDAITKYHPDANRSKSPEEQKRAEQMFKKVAAARKVMLNPTTAKPEPDDLDMSAGSSSQPGNARPASTAASNAERMRAYQAQQAHPASQARPQQDYRASAASSQYVPQGHNTSRDFNDGQPRVVDPAEGQIADIYRQETRESYLSFSDKARLTPSWATSCSLLVLSLVLFFMASFSLESISLSNPCLVMALVCLAKLAVYDMFASYYVFKALRKPIRHAWGFLSGCELLVFGIIGALLMATSPLANALAVPAFGCAAGVGLVIGAVSLIASKARK